jgi:flagellin-like protein
MTNFVRKTRSWIVNRNHRSGVSPVIASTILIGITVVLGLALWSFANSGVGTATKEYAEGVSEYGRFTSDKFVIANMDFDNPDANPSVNVSFWIFNSGRTSTTINDVVFMTRSGCGNWAPTGLTQQNPDDPFAPLSVGPDKLKKFSFDSGDDLSGCSGETFELTVVSETGATQTFVKKG